MSVMYILIPIAIILTGIGIYLFFWAVKTEQFEDLEKQGMSILFDDSPQDITDKNTAKLAETNNNQKQQNNTDVE